VHEIVKNIYWVYSVILIKTFDSVGHELLILKLDFYGVKCSILNWLKSYLH